MHECRLGTHVTIALLCIVQPTHVPVGKMDIVWRTKFGDKGRIQTGQLKTVVREFVGNET